MLNHTTDVKIKVVTFETSDGKTRYYLADDTEAPVKLYYSSLDYSLSTVYE